MSNRTTVANRPERVTVNYRGTLYDLVRVGYQRRDENGRAYWTVAGCRPRGRKVYTGTLKGWTDGGGLVITMSSRPEPSIDHALGNTFAPDSVIRASAAGIAAGKYREIKALWKMGAVAGSGWLTDSGEKLIAGAEQFKIRRTSRHGTLEEFWHFDYRSHSGAQFSTIADTLEECRARRDSWLAEHHAAEYYDLKQSELDAGDADLCEGSGR